MSWRRRRLLSAVGVLCAAGPATGRESGTGSARTNRSAQLPGTPPELTWHRAPDFEGPRKWVDALVPLSSGRVLLAGTAADGSNSGVPWASVVRRDGDVVWSRTYPITDQLTLRSAHQLPDGRLLLGIPFGPKGGGGVLSLDRDGTRLQTRQLGHTYAMVDDGEGNALVGGTESLTASSHTGTVRRIGPGLDTLNEYTFGSQRFLKDVTVRSDGRVLVAGHRNDEDDRPHGWFGGVDGSGTTWGWVFQIDTVPTRCYGVAPVPDTDEAVVCGTLATRDDTYGGPDETTGFVARLSRSVGVRWHHLFNPTIGTDEPPDESERFGLVDVVRTADGYVAAGEFVREGPTARAARLVAVTADGQVRWDERYAEADGNDVPPPATEIHPAGDGGYLLGGTAPASVYKIGGHGDTGGGGTGGDDGVVEIETLADLQAVREDLTADYRLVSDLDASETADWNDGAGFDPIGEGDGDPQFTGTFDGNGHAIRGLRVDRPDAVNVGLFGSVYGGTVRELTLENCSVTGRAPVGVLAGTTRRSTVEGCSVSGRVDAEQWGGGLVGLASGGTVRNCSASGTVDADAQGGGLVGGSESVTVVESVADVTTTGGRNVGGLVGRGDGLTIRRSTALGSTDGGTHVGGLGGTLRGGTVEASHAGGDVDGGKRTGGLIGNAVGGSVIRCAASGAVDGDRNVGGLVGYHTGQSTEETVVTAVRESVAKGSVTGGRWTGGLIGTTTGVAVMDCYATAGVDGEKVVAGLVGAHIGQVARSYAAGAVSGTETTGGVVAKLNDGTVTESYWDVDETGQQESAGLPAENGLDTAAMTGDSARESLDGFDFDDTWVVGAAHQYPHLRWQEGQPDAPTTVDDDEPSDASTTSVPGFGVVAGAVGAGAAGYLLKRRADGDGE